MLWLKRRWPLVVGLAVVLAVALTTASLAARGGSSASPFAQAQVGQAQEPAEPEDEGVHGGPHPRFHNAGACPLPGGAAKLQGNWTHGDYVTAWEKADATRVREAAHSPCGKPAHVAKRKAGQGPGKAAAAGKAERPRKVRAPEPQPPRST